MTHHIWLRSEQRLDETRSPLIPSGASQLLQAGFEVTVEKCPRRVFDIEEYRDAGCKIADEGSWRKAPTDAYILGLKELAADGKPLIHQHIYFGHAFKGQTEAPGLLARFAQGGGTLLDLEYLTDTNGRRVAAFGYWAGFAGAALGLLSWLSLHRNKPELLVGLTPYTDQSSLVAFLRRECRGLGSLPSAIVIGALGRVGTGACDLADHLGVSVTKWDMAETASGGPFPQILEHEIFINCILAGENTPRFLTQHQLRADQRLSVVADIACDPNNPRNPIPIYDRATSIGDPVIRLTNTPREMLVMAVDNLPALLPRESTEDFATQLLPYLLELGEPQSEIWRKAADEFNKHS